MKINSLCPCGSEQLYETCCGVFIRGLTQPTTPEQLMRSRYTAYTQANIDYIARTMRGKAAQSFNSAEAKQWALSVKWLSLEIIHSQSNYVEFIASYLSHGAKQQIHELSEFQQENNQWYYVDGTVKKPSR